MLSDISEKFTEDRVLEIVKKCGGEAVKKWLVKEGFSKGDSYLSEVRRMLIVGLDKDNKEIEINAVVKSLPRVLARRRTFRSDEFFAKEGEFFNKIWPAFEEFQAKYNIPNPFKAVPRCLMAYIDGEHDFLVLEDLTFPGYRPGDRQKGLDVDHCRLAIQCLGSFHALSLAIKQLEPKVWEEITKNMADNYHSENSRKWYEEMAEIQIKVARDAVSKEYPNTEIEKKALEFTDSNFYNRMVELTHTYNQYSVINHGDCWLPNFLMKYNDKDVPIDGMIIDFQLVRLTSPALDISFFIYSCTDEAMREKYYDGLLKDYHSSVTALLKQFELDPETVFPYSALEEEMIKFGKFGVGMGMEAIPLCITDEATDLDLIVGETPLPLKEVWKLKMLETKEDRLRLADVFKHAVEHKYL